MIAEADKVRSLFILNLLLGLLDLVLHPGADNRRAVHAYFEICYELSQARSAGSLPWLYLGIAEGKSIPVQDLNLWWAS
jgi:hypothetical protein